MTAEEQFREAVKRLLEENEGREVYISGTNDFEASISLRDAFTIDSWPMASVARVKRAVDEALPPMLED